MKLVLVVNEDMEVEEAWLADGLAVLGKPLTPEQARPALVILGCGLLTAQMAPARCLN